MKAHELLNSPYRWTRHAGARDHRGDKVGVLDERATCWCLAGALSKCYGLDGAYDALNKVKLALLDRGITEHPINFNDSHTYDEVLEILKEVDV